MHACMYVCMYVCIYVCMYVCMYIEKFAYVHIHVHACTYLCVSLACFPSMTTAVLQQHGIRIPPEGLRGPQHEQPEAAFVVSAPSM